MKTFSNILGSLIARAIVACLYAIFILLSLNIFEFLNWNWINYWGVSLAAFSCIGLIDAVKR